MKCISLPQLVILYCVLSAPVFAADVDIVYTESVELAAGNWQALPEREVKSTVADAVLATLKQTPGVRVWRANNTGRNGNLDITIDLRNPGAAKTMLNLYSPATGEISSTATISLTGLDAAAEREALKYLGTEAAGRLAASISPNSSGGSGGYFAKKSDELQQLFEQAMELKRRSSYADAHNLFERIAGYRGADGGQWPQLARDEARYGLPMFRAKNLLYGGSDFPSKPQDMLDAFTEAENLLRQVIAQNRDNSQRIIEAQALLDQVQISRSSLQNSVRGDSTSQAQPLKVMLSEIVMEEGVCPNSSEMKKFRPNLPERIRIDRITGHGKVRKYYLTDPTTGVKSVLECDAGKPYQPVRFVEQ